MLNRHAIVLFLGSAALLLLREVPPDAAPLWSRGPLPQGLMGAAFLFVVGGLFLDNGIPGARARVAHLLQCAGAILLVIDSVGLFAGGKALPLAMARAGIALTVLGVWLEMTSRLTRLRTAIALHLAGDALYLVAFALGIATMNRTPNALGWVFIVLTGGLGLYAAITNGLLQVIRLRNPQAGWRYRVLEWGTQGLRLKTPAGERQIDWNLIEAVKPLDDRHLILVLLNNLPEALRQGDLPMDELRTSAEPQASDLTTPPDRLGLVFHEQELGRSIPEAAAWLQQRLVPAAAP